MPTDEVIEPVEAEQSFDIDAAVEKIGADLFPQAEVAHDQQEAAPEKPPGTPPPASVPAPASVAPPADSTAPAAAAVPTVREAPKSWPKDMHDHWGKTPKEVQDYWDKREKQMLDGLDQYKDAANRGKAFQDVLAPFQQTLQAQGYGNDAPRAVHTLLNAHARLTTGSMEQRQAAYRELGQSLKLIDGTGQAAPAPPPVDPQIQALQSEVTGFKDYIKQQQEAVYKETYDKAQKEVEAFASDPTHPHFDDCHADIMTLIQAGKSLQDAYDQAVWANPVTRAKELARVQTESEAKFRENARLSALPKKQAKGVNITSRDSMRTPTEAAEGTMDDTLKSTLKSIRERTH